MCLFATLSCFSSASAEWKPEYGNNKPHIRWWFQKKANMTLAAEERFKPFFETLPDLAVPNRPLTEEDKKWMDKAETTQEFRERQKWQSCCNHGDRVKTKFFVDEKNADRWYFFGENGERIDIPADVVHHEDDPTMPQELKDEGVLFVYVFGPKSGNFITCFWPPRKSGL